jgi:hypothetical protein
MLKKPANEAAWSADLPLAHLAREAQRAPEVREEYAGYFIAWPRAMGVENEVGWPFSASY